VLYSAFDVVPSPKGASTHIQHFVSGLVAAGHSVLLATPIAPGLSSEDQFAGARHMRLGTPGSGNFLWRALEFGEQVARIAEAEGPFDVAHYRSVWSGFALLMARDRLGYATLFEANSLPSVELPFHYPDLRGLATLDKIRRLERTVLAESDAILCVSRVTRTFLTGCGARARRIEVVPNGVDPSAFAVTPLPASKDRVPTLLYIGTLADWQGLATAVEALPRLLERGPVRLRIVGRGRSRQRKELLRRVRRLGLETHVSVEPGVPHEEVPALIAQADICLAPLGYNDRNVVQGCCPLKLLESAACGRPIVASNLPVVRELLREERDALLVPPDAPDALAAAVLRLLGQPRLARRLADHAARRVRTHFTWTRAQERLLKLYERLLTARGTGRDKHAARTAG
jgi:glycosyltransferase involved in cell wall biosynthesis